MKPEELKKRILSKWMTITKEEVVEENEKEPPIYDHDGDEIPKSLEKTFEFRFLDAKPVSLKCTYYTRLNILWVKGAGYNGVVLPFEHLVLHSKPEYILLGEVLYFNL